MANHINNWVYPTQNIWLFKDSYILTTSNNHHIFIVTYDSVSVFNIWFSKVKFLAGQRFIKLAKSPISPPLAFPFKITSSGVVLLDDDGIEMKGSEINTIQCQGLSLSSLAVNSMEYVLCPKNT